LEAKSSRKGLNEANEDKNAKDKDNDARERPMEAKSSRRGQSKTNEDKMQRTRKMMPGRGRWRSKAQDGVKKANEDIERQ
jgi:hypothetical protein